MANEKILNTRIGLKYDSLAKWNSSSIVLKAGEVAFATTAASAGNGLTEPVIMAKIGDGSKTFSQLDWSFYAKAADVHAWAKQDQTSFETYLKSFIGETIEDTDNNTTYAFAIVDGKLQITETPHVLGVAGTPVVSSLDFVTPDELTTILGNYYTKEEVGEQITAAIEALDSSASQEAGADGLALSVTAADGKITAISGSIAANTYDAYGSAESAKSAVIGDASSTKDSDTVKGAKLYAADAVATAVAGLDAEVSQTAGADGLALSITEVDGKITAISGSIAAETYDAYGAAATALEDAKAYTDDMKDAILGEGISDTFDTLVEIQNWINGAGVNATELTEAIAAEARAREDGDALKVDKTTYEAYIAGKSLSDEELKADAQGYANTAEQNAKAYADALTEIGDESATISASQELVNISSNMSVAISSNGILNISCGSQNIDFAGDGSSITVTGDMQVQEPINNSSVSTKKYVDDALAAAKEYADNNDADTLYQAGEGLALNVDAKGNNVFSIDDSLTWIFDCGTSAN